MKKLPIALQLYSVRDDLAADFEGTLQKVAEMGYEGVEFAGLYDHGPAEIKKTVASLGLNPISAHVPYVEMTADPEKVLSVYREIGCRFVAVPYLTEEYRPGTPGFPKVIEAVKLLGKTAKSLGMTLLYHNHDFEFQKIDGKYALDLLYDSVPADLLKTELDTCWVNVAGEDPAAYIRKYAGRAPVVHLKDFIMKGRKKPEHLYDLIGIKPEESGKPAEETFGFRPVGYGVQNVPELLKASGEAGTEWLVVEQDQPAPGTAPIDQVRLSIDYLNGKKA